MTSQPEVSQTPAGSAPSGNRNVMIVLSYLWFLFLVPLLVEKEDREVQWHAKHGLVLFVAELIVWIAFGVVTAVIGIITAGLGCLIPVLSPLLILGFLILRVFCIIKGINGQRLIIPGISPYADKF